ncbi:MAG TPA: hypothetical protein VF157_01910 [Chloroflexota bacterium]
MQDRYRGGGGGGNRYGSRRRGRGRGRPRDIFPEVGIQEPEEHASWAEDYEREPNPDAEPLHLAYDSVYTHEGDVREELLEAWVEASASGKRWRCWNCGRQTQRFTQLRLPTLRTVISICDNCGTWTVWDAWRDLANPRIFSFRRTLEESEPAREPGRADTRVPQQVGSNGHGGQPEPAAAPAAQTPQFTEAAPPVASEPALQPSAPPEASPTESEAVAAARPRRGSRTRTPAATEDSPTEEEAPKPRATRSRAKKPAEEPPGE